MENERNVNKGKGGKESGRKFHKEGEYRNE